MPTHTSQGSIPLPNPISQPNAPPHPLSHQRNHPHTQAVQLGGLPAVYPALPQRPGSRQNFDSVSRPMSAVSYAGSLPPGQHAARPTSVLTPSELGDDPSQLLSAEMSRASLLVS